MNIYFYWSRGPEQLIRNLALFFTTCYRPVGGIYYSVLYHFYGLNPLPYHLVTAALLLLNIWLAYRFASSISGSQLTGGLSALLVAYHPDMIDLIYRPAFIYDVACFTFYYCALNYYIWVRMTGRRMTAGRVCIFVLLYIGALESKEMAVTLPLMTVLYELFWRLPYPWSVARGWNWAKKAGGPSLLAAIVTVAFVVGKAFGAESLLRMEAYRPVITWHRYIDSTTRFVNTVLYQGWDDGFFGCGKVLLLAVGALFIAWKTRSRHLRLMWFLIVVSPLPITFVPGRGGACLYIPLMGWAVFFSTVFVMFTAAVSRLTVVRRISARIVEALLVTSAVALLWFLNADRTTKEMGWYQEGGKLTRSVLQQIRWRQPTVKPGARIYVVNDVFDGFDTMFLIALTYKDHSVQVFLEQHQHLTPAEIGKMDYIFRFDNGVLSVQKRPA